LKKVKCGNGWGSYQLAAGADLDGGGLADIVGKDKATEDVYFYKGLGNGKFAMKRLVVSFTPQPNVGASSQS
jgi:hypothetical protein